MISTPLSYLKSCGRVWIRENDLDCCPACVLARDEQFAAHRFGSFSYSQQAESVMLAPGLKASAIIVKTKAQFLCLERKARSKFTGLRVPKRICQNFLTNTQQVFVP